MWGFATRRKLLFALVIVTLAILLPFFRSREPAEGPRQHVKGKAVNLIYVFAASTAESQAVEQLLNRYDQGTSGLVSGRVGVNEVVLFVTGIGPKAARSRAAAALLGSREASPTHLFSQKLDAVIVIGTCGSLSESIEEDEIIIYRQCLTTSSSSSTNCTRSLVDHLTTVLKRSGLETRPAVGISTERIATSKEEKLELARSGAEVVDMESYEIVTIANQAGLPVAVIRVVSDSLEREIPDFNPALLENGEIDPLQAAKVAAGSPIQTAKILASSRRAVKTLSEVLEIVLADDDYSNFHSDQK